MKKYLFKFFSSSIIFFFTVSTIILAFNLIPLVTNILHSPSGRTFALIHNNAQDFFFYQSLMNEGAQGSWLTSDPYTTEDHQPSIIFSYFLWLGKLSSILKLPYAVTYHLIRLILSILFLFAAYYLIFQIKLPHPKLTFFFFVFASPFLHLIEVNGKKEWVPYMYWWTGIDPVRRAAYLPHHMFGELFLVLSLIFLLKYMKQPEGKPLFFLTLFSALLAFVHTPSLMILLLTLPPAIFIFILTAGKNTIKGLTSSKETYKTKDDFIGKINQNYKKYLGLLVYWLISLSFLFLMLSQTSKGFPWSQYIVWEKRLQFPLNRELIGALGILFPFAVFGALQALISKRFAYILSVSWLFVPFLFIPLAPFLNFSNIRLIQGVPYLPLAILAVIGIDTLSAKFFHRINKKILHGLILTVFLIFTIPTIYLSVKDQIKEYWPIFGNVYFDNRLQKAFNFINSNFPKGTRTLSTFYTGNYLPAYTHTVSFIGHFGYTYKIDDKQALTRKFFENKMSLEEAKELIMNNKIVLIFQGPEEKPIYQNYLYPNLLKPVYDTEEVTIYTIK